MVIHTHIQISHVAVGVAWRVYAYVCVFVLFPIRHIHNLTFSNTKGKYLFKSSQQWQPGTDNGQRATNNGQWNSNIQILLNLNIKFVNWIWKLLLLFIQTNQIYAKPYQYFKWSNLSVIMQVSIFILFGNFWKSLIKLNECAEKLNKQIVIQIKTLAN